MPRKFKPRQRLSGVRDAKLIIIASEGAQTEPKYFRELASQYINSKVKVYVLEREDASASSPGHVFEELDKFKTEYNWEDNDEFWLVLDVDRWGDAKLAEVGRLCHQKGYMLAVSNPCFELWLLLHLRSLNAYPPETLAEFRANPRIGVGRRRLDVELITILGEYNKSNLKTQHFLPHIEDAIGRAKELDNLDHRWPDDLGSRVYLLAEEIIRQKPGATTA